jgi:hypothetical protein
MIHNYWDMKKYLIIVLFLGVANLGWAQATAPSRTPVVSAGTDLPVSGWCVMGAKDMKFGPKEEGGKIIFTGEGFGAKGHHLAAFFPLTEIGEGQTLKMRANVRFVGVATVGSFRYGLFRKLSRDHSLGWLGYCAYAGFNQFWPKGALLARFPGNNGYWDVGKDLKGQEAARILGDSLTGINAVRDGAYVVVWSLKKSGGAIEIESSMDGADVPTPMVRYSAKDSTPATSSFDALGFMIHKVLSTDSIEFSDISLKLQGP